MEAQPWLAWGGLDDRKLENHKRAVCFVQLSLSRLSKNSVCSDEEAEAGAAKSVLFFFSLWICITLVLKLFSSKCSKQNSFFFFFFGKILLASISSVLEWLKNKDECVGCSGWRQSCGMDMLQKRVLLRPTQILGVLCQCIFRCKLLELLWLRLYSRIVRDRSRACRRLTDWLAGKVRNGLDPEFEPQVM